MNGDPGLRLCQRRSRPTPIPNLRASLVDLHHEGLGGHRPAGLVHPDARRRHSVGGTECRRRESGCTRPAQRSQLHRSACSAHRTLTQAPRGVVPLPGTRATGESCAQPATPTVIESYLYPSRTGRVVAQIGRTRAHGDRTVKMNVPVPFLLGTSLCGFDDGGAGSRNAGYARPQLCLSAGRREVACALSGQATHDAESRA